jgi:hypothetical protein
MSTPTMTPSDLNRLLAAMRGNAGPCYDEWHDQVGRTLTPCALEDYGRACWEAARMLGYLEGAQAGRDEQAARTRLLLERVRVELAWL